jgi:hypothetical protein
MEGRSYNVDRKGGLGGGSKGAKSSFDGPAVSWGGTGGSSFSSGESRGGLGWRSGRAAPGGVP